ncbi:hypothetical protein GJ698_25425 [Pseudoduganella sp. FT26W]|uniref:Uncharacterized protein n=1 Tax=Duganella aquatilis TaxID=2666082 RepID=A0A844DEX5_9BURK|nr:hypothetical protein [Duganella aquatilis]MRW87416.1 hypothetical protein [Duganella aquatilis]
MHSPRWRRRGWLALIAGAHLLAFLCLRPPERPLAAPVTPHEPITYILAPPKRVPAPTPAVRPARTAAKAAPVARSVQQAGPQPITLPPPEPAPAQAITAPTLPPDPFALPGKPEPDLKQRAIAGAAAADKLALKESWTQRDRKLVNDETALAAAIGKAYRGGGIRQVEMIAADGSRITKFIMPGGKEVCYTAASNNFSGGRDPFRDSGKIIAGPCPH